jgi:hypothetical protein
MNKPLRIGAIWAVLLACQLATAQEIYVCIDSKGHKLTSDRPIAECLDREQRVFGSSGTVKRTIGPSLTAQERATQEELQRHEAEEQARLADEKRRDRALLLRYPNRALHDQERAEALIQVDAVMHASQLRLQELAQQRKDLDAEMEFYKKDPSKAPAVLKRRISENGLSVAAQQRFMATQEEEKKRINQRFDEELVKLQPRWALQAPPPLAGSPAKGK